MVGENNGLSFSFKMQFLRLSGRKTDDFFPAGPFFLVLNMIFDQNALIPRKVSSPKEFLVICLVGAKFLFTPFTFLCSLLSSTKNEIIFGFNPTNSLIRTTAVSSFILLTTIFF